jgi:hypothetical protein
MARWSCLLAYQKKQEQEEVITVLKAYSKPGLTRVDLVPNESVLCTCKDAVVASEPGGPGGSCGGAAYLPNCSQVGS